MPSWIITCRNCHAAFEHAKINDYTLLDFLSPMKPVPVEGIQVECPNCGTKAVYVPTDLFYRH